MDNYVDEFSYIEPNEHDTVIFHDYQVFVDPKHESDSDIDIDDEHVYSEEDWITENYNQIRVIYKDIKDMLYLPLFSRLSLSELGQYLQYTNCSYAKKDTYNWDDPEIHHYICDMVKVKTPQDFVRNNFVEIRSLYKYLSRTYDYHFGCFEDFIKFSYFNR